MERRLSFDANTTRPRKGMFPFSFDFFSSLGNYDRIHKSASLNYMFFFTTQQPIEKENFNIKLCVYLLEE